MNSEHEECPEPVEVKSDLEASGPVPENKPRRRHRRGKRRKQRRESGGQGCESESAPHDCDSDEEDLPELYPASSFASCKLRPLDVPKAPENSTQFLIDDHNGSTSLYMSFETPNPYLANGKEEHPGDYEIVEPDEEDAAFLDINYEYESPQDFDNSKYFEQEFQDVYKEIRFTDLLRMPRTELVREVDRLENRLKVLSEERFNVPNAVVTLNQLQHELLELQEKHTELLLCNQQLRSLTGAQDIMETGAPAADSSGEGEALHSSPVHSPRSSKSPERVNEMEVPLQVSESQSPERVQEMEVSSEPLERTVSPSPMHVADKASET